MKNTTKILLGLLIVPALTFAQTEEMSDLKAQIETLKTERTELKKQVKSGEMTKEEAKAIWAQKMETIRVQKEKTFETRVQNLQKRFTKRAETHPANAEFINARLEKVTSLLTSQRTERKAFYEGLRTKIKSGELTKEEAKEMRKTKHEALKSNRKAERETFKTERKERVKENQRQRTEERKTFREDVRSKVENEEMTKEEAKEVFNERREAQTSKRDERMQNLKEQKPELYERNLERQNQRRETRGENRMERNPELSERRMKRRNQQSEEE